MSASPNQQLSDVAARALTDEGRANEYRIAIVRVFAYSVVALVGIAYTFAGLRPASEIPVLGGVAAMSAVILIALRRTYVPAFRFVIPTFDALVMVFLLHRRMALSGATPGLIATCAAAASLFAATGGLRFDRWAAAWTTLLAAAVLAVTGGPYLGDALPYVLCSLIGVGVLSVWQTDFLRRIIRGEQGRAMLRRFIDKRFVDRAFTDPEALMAPTQRDATVLVTDLRGFTSLAEGLQPAEVVEILNELHSALAEVIARSGGVVDKFMGDGMLAVFGAQEALTDHAARAMAAAIAIRRSVAAINVRHRERAPLRVGIGIHSGPVVAGVIGGGRKMEYTVIGDTVNTASRLESLTKERGVDLLVSESTAKSCGAGPFKDLGEVEIRGRSRTLRLFTPAPDFVAPELDADAEVSFAKPLRKISPS